MLIAAAAAMAGCSSGSSSSGGQASCTRTESLPDGSSSKTCQELTGSAEVVPAVRQACVEDGGTQYMEEFANGPCSRVGALGGCSTTAGTTVVTSWYYAGSLGPQTAADVQMMCSASGGTFVQP